MKVVSIGDRAISCVFEEEPSDELTDLITTMAGAARSLGGVRDSACGHRSLLLEVDPNAASEIAKSMAGLAVSSEPMQGELQEVQIRYDGEDVDWVCRHGGVTADELSSIHSSRTYVVRTIGSPGFIYLSEVDSRIASPRLDEPRRLVQAGSVGIAGRQTGIYGRNRPGGWRLIGSIKEIPTVRPGDRIRFVPK